LGDKQLTYKVLTTSQPDYLHKLISVQSSGRTRSFFCCHNLRFIWHNASVIFTKLIRISRLRVLCMQDNSESVEGNLFET